MNNKTLLKSLALLLACMMCVPSVNAQGYEYDDTWNIDGIEYAWEAAEAVVIGRSYGVTRLVIPDEVNLYLSVQKSDGIDRIVPVAIIGNSVFMDDVIETVDLGPNVSDLRYHSFYNCTDLTDIVCRSTTPPYVNDAFSSNMYSRVTLHVPSSALTAYKNHTEWKKFTNIVAITSEWGVDINSTNFPDANFRNYLLSLYPKGYLTREDIQNCTTLDLGSKSISNAKGIEFFTELQMLNLYNNAVSTINLSQNTKLTYLNMGYNQLTSINLSTNTAMERLFLQHNKLTTVSVTDHSKLNILWVKDNTLLTNLYCYRNNLTQLSVTGCTALKDLRCYYNYNLTSISGLEDCTAIIDLDCEDCAITDLSAVNNMSNIENLLCRNNNLSSLPSDVFSGLSKLVDLQTLFISSIPLFILLLTLSSPTVLSLSHLVFSMTSIP